MRPNACRPRRARARPRDIVPRAYRGRGGEGHDPAKVGACRAAKADDAYGLWGVGCLLVCRQMTGYSFAIMWLARLFAVAGLLLAASAVRAQEGSYRGPTRVNFDERLIKGQTTKAGSVYIFDRQEITIESLVARNRSFRARIIRTVFEE